MIKVKICGLTRLEDALVAADAGADYLGFIFYPPSPRSITPDEAAALIAHLRGTTDDRRRATEDGRQPRLVGVFVNETADHMAAVLDRCGLDLAQLSGVEDATSVTDPRSPLYGRAYKALRPRSLEDAAVQAAQFATPDATSGPRLLLDTPHGHLYGGSGATGDWAVAAAVAAQTPRLMLAGGLTPDNVAEAIGRARPWAVDVASGVEVAPGRKDPALVRAFIRNAQAA